MAGIRDPNLTSGKQVTYGSPSRECLADIWIFRHVKLLCECVRASMYIYVSVYLFTNTSSTSPKLPESNYVISDVDGMKNVTSCTRVAFIWSY